jgi:hypothetical protein
MPRPRSREDIDDAMGLARGVRARTLVARERLEESGQESEVAGLASELQAAERHLRRSGVELGDGPAAIADRVVVDSLLLASTRLHRLNARALVQVARDALEMRDRLGPPGGGRRRVAGQASVSDMRDILLEVAQQVAALGDITLATPPSRESDVEQPATGA